MIAPINETPKPVLPFFAAVSFRKSGSKRKLKAYYDFPEISKRDEKRINSMLQIGLETLKANRENRYFLAAVGMTRNGEVYVGVPQDKTHTIMLQYHHMQFPIWLHAEMDLVIKARANNATLDKILVVRIHKKSGILKLAKPCDLCQNMIGDLQPKAKIYYTTNHSSIEEFHAEEAS